jgi:hypothetical protein
MASRGGRTLDGRNEGTKEGRNEGTKERAKERETSVSAGTRPEGGERHGSAGWRTDRSQTRRK